jgi:hypothetical protein
MKLHHTTTIILGRTRSHDVSQTIEALLKYIEAAAAYAILDLGRGPGRDLKAFRYLGHAPVN